MNFTAAVVTAIYIALGYVFAHVTYNKSERAVAEGRIVTPRWMRFGLSLAIIVIWPIVPFALASLYATHYWRKNV
jgi:hypothetical protein